jgi:RNA 2',3'-cyclic 3'-phosphodiesterase
MDAGARPPRMPTVRLFVALWPTPTVRAALAARRDAIGWPAGSAPVADERLHLTVHFLGAVAIDRLTALVPALITPWQPMALSLGDTVHWPRGLVVLPVLRPPAALQWLHAALAERLTALGVPVEPRAFKPHVTLARRAERTQPAPPAAPLRWRPGGYALVRSDPARGYHVLARYGPRGVTIPASRGRP